MRRRWVRKEDFRAIPRRQILWCGAARRIGPSGSTIRIHARRGRTFPEAARVFPTQAFDAIFFNDVLEHMVDPAAALLATRRLLSPTGYVIASIPNVRHLSVWWPLIRYGDWPYADSGLLDRTHLKFFTRKTIVLLFQQTGWTTESITGINRTRWPDSNIDTWKTRWLGRLTLGRTDEIFFVQYVVVARLDPIWLEISY